MAKPISLRLRLGLQYGLIVAFLQAAMFGAVLWNRSGQLRQQFDNQMRHEASQIAERLVESPDPYSRDLLVDAATRPRLFSHIILRDASDNIITAINLEDSEFDASALPFPPAVGEADRARFRTWEPPADGPLDISTPHRVMTYTFHDDSKRTFHLQASAEAGYLQQLTASAFDLFVIVLPIGVVTACLAAWLLAGHATRPLERLTRQAESIEPDDIQPLHGDGENTEISQLQEALNDALKRLERGFRSREQFIGNVAHDLKSAITAVLTQAQVLRQRNASAEEQHEFVTSVEEEMRHLNGLIDSFLLLARSAHGSTAVAEDDVSVNDIVLTSVERCTRLARNKNIRIVPNLLIADDCLVEPEIRGDFELLCAMLENIIRNAIEASPPEAVINVDGHCEDVTAEFRIVDNGPGIPQEVLDHLFERYGNGNGNGKSKKSRRKGHGLGLAIAKSVADLHEGTIEARNREEGGAEFVITIPLITPMMRVAEQPAAQTCDD